VNKFAKVPQTGTQVAICGSQHVENYVTMS